MQPRSTYLQFDVVSLVVNASPPMLALSILLVIASFVVLFTSVLKLRQLRRWVVAERVLHQRIVGVTTLSEAREVLSQSQDAIGYHLLALTKHGHAPWELLEAESEYRFALQEQRVFAGLTVLATIATVAPLGGLFGTVYGIMEAFSHIDQIKGAPLELLAPAIGDALVTTILGLFAAIPAVFTVNLLSRRGELLLGQSRAFARAWLQRVSLLPE